MYMDAVLGFRLLRPPLSFRFPASESLELSEIRGIFCIGVLTARALCFGVRLGFRVSGE